MDDQHFDDFIKKKADAYQETGVDPAALADFRNRLDRLPLSPWYVRYRTPMGWAAALALFTLINVGLVWYFSQKKDGLLQAQLVDLKVDQQELQELRAEIEYLKSARTDTVYVYRSIGSGQLLPGTENQNGNSSYGSGLDSEDYQTSQDYQTGASGSQRSAAFVIAQDEEGRSFLRLGRYQDLSKEVQAFVSQSASISTDDQGNLYLPLIRNSGKQLAKLASISPVGVDGSIRSLAFSQVEKAALSSKDKPRLSGKIVRAMEKQQYSGWGFQAGAELQQFKSIPDLGESKVNSGIGLLGEFILSPRWRVEAGALQSNMRYEIDGFSEDASLLEQINNYPGYQSQLGELNEIGISATFLKLPVNLKYYYPIAAKSRLYISGGFTPYLYLSQRFSYTYTESENSGVETFVASKQTVEDGKLYFGTATTGLGAEIDLNERLKWQIGLFYEKGLADFGIEANRVNTIGLKSSVWFRVK